MSESELDIWAQWILQTRFGGDTEQMKSEVINFLYPLRDMVLEHAKLADNETLLDVGCGDGLIAFGALDTIKTSRVIFSDISQDLLDHSQVLANKMQVIDRCEFLQASADDLAAVNDASVDVVTTRSVLIYVKAKQQAFNEFFRVLRPKGRLSIFEPINRFAFPEPPHLYAGYDVTPIMSIVDKVKNLYVQLQPIDSDPILDFDERDLMIFAEKAGFKEIHLALHADIEPPSELENWNNFIHIAPNPRVPNLGEAMRQTLTPAEAERFIAHMRPLVESKQGTSRWAVAYLWAVKN